MCLWAGRIGVLNTARLSNDLGGMVIPELELSPEELGTLVSHIIKNASIFFIGISTIQATTTAGLNDARYEYIITNAFNPFKLAINGDRILPWLGISQTLSLILMLKSM